MHWSDTWLQLYLVPCVCIQATLRWDLQEQHLGSSTSEHKGECAGSELPGWATQQPSWFLQAGTKAQS